MNIEQIIADELKIKLSQVEATVKLIDEGNTIPFIARYRKEMTGSLNDEVLRNLYERLTYLRGLEERKATVLASIEEQGKLDDELKARIEAAQTMVVLEDLYRPYKPKRVTWQPRSCCRWQRSRWKKKHSAMYRKKTKCPMWRRRCREQKISLPR